MLMVNPGRMNTMPTNTGQLGPMGGQVPGAMGGQFPINPGISPNVGPAPRPQMPLGPQPGMVGPAPRPQMPPHMMGIGQGMPAMGNQMALAQALRGGQLR